MPQPTEVSMKHSIGYLGHFDRDVQNLHPGPRNYVREDGSLGQVDDRPQDVDGVFFGYLECRGKTFVAVRAQYGDADIILKTPVPLDPPRHTDGKGFGPNPSRFGDDSAAHLLADMITKNPDVAVTLQSIAAQLGLALK